MVTDVHILDTTLLSYYKYSLKKITYGYSNNDKPMVNTREVYDRGNGAVILLYNPVSKTVILTRQFRLPSFLNGNTDGMLVEACAGLLDREDPETCIRRETEEETGYRLTGIRKVYEAYMSPGSVTEILHFFIAEYNASMKMAEGGGLEEEHEHIEVLEIAFDEAMRMTTNGGIKDAKTILLLQHLKLNALI
ncbi:NUDIX domain-containing protein [Sediminibacterium soli]|uniref:NUDIX domain-containing protein n=1 Tax=Sediminibacterium soli TaxID=2698829 RepID=UPI00137A0408|nr:NUDIX domain-containing protein [Sediminibacterium soli]NCI46044.1 NUDIX domain-containing protein [Sediminibacterium soli]